MPPTPVGDERKSDFTSCRVALAFPFPAPAEVDSAATAFEEAGYSLKVRPFDAFWGQRYATAMDPNGVCVDLFAPLP